MAEKRKLSNSEMFLTGFIWLVLINILFYLFRSGINGNDFWWHVKAGEYICTNHVIPKTDIFSWMGMEKGISWTAHEWLSEVIFYSVFSAFGEIGMFIFSLSLSIAMSGLIYRQVKDQLKNNYLVGWLYLCLFAVVSSFFFYGRPHIFGFFLLFAELKILYAFFNDQKSRGIFFLPLISALWSNLHGGSSNLSYILCILFLVIGSINLNIGRIQSVKPANKDLIKLAAITVLTVLAIFANPIGLKVFLYPYESFADNISMTFISEWHAPDAKNIGSLFLYYFPIALFSLGMLASEKKIKLIDVGVMGLFLLLFFRSARFIILWYIAASFCCFQYLPVWEVKKIEKTWEKAILCVVTLLLLATPAYSVKEMVNTAKDGTLISTAMRDEAVDFIKQDAPSRLFNDYNFGETLIYNEIPVYFDARADLFAQEDIMANGVGMMLLNSPKKDDTAEYVDVNGFVKENRIDAIVILKKRPLYAFLISHPDKYRLAYSDDEAVYFKVIS